MKACSESSERNKEPILRVLQQVLPVAGTVLEIGSGTGQHAVYFGAGFPDLVWQTSDLAENHADIRAWLDEAGLGNVRLPLTLDVDAGQWPHEPVEAVFSANTAHIMSWGQVQAMLSGVGQVLADGGVLCLYGPFNYDGNYTSESNAAFDRFLRDRDPQSGIRDFEAINACLKEAGLVLWRDYAMPNNNHLVVWKKPRSGDV
ncbi:MAG: DUF938 domain-containing protein [Gammaproteobacteria bacterium]|nr:MAG: DUF938 domain-containing protein [Gammaproteobacteria bacterium]